MRLEFMLVLRMPPGRFLLFVKSKLRLRIAKNDTTIDFKPTYIHRYHKHSLFFLIELHPLKRLDKSAGLIFTEKASV